MLTVIHKSNVPNGGYYFYVCEETGVTLKHPYYGQLAVMAKQHRIVNNLPIGSNWLVQFEENVCKNTPAQICNQKADDTVVDIATRFAKAMIKWAASGFKTVSGEVFAQRLAVCESCPNYSVKAVLGRAGCKLCRCTSKKLYLATERCPDNPPRWI